MATYYTNSSNQRDATPMIYLPGSYPDAPIHPGNMMMYMNSGSYSDSLADNSQQQSHCMEIQSVEGPETTYHQQEILSSIGGSRTAEHDFNAWRDGRNEMLVMHSIDGPSSVLHAGQNLQGQGLSLSLGTQIPSAIHMPSSPFRNPSSTFPPFFNHIPSPMSEGGGRTSSSRDEQSRNVDYLPPGFAASNQDSNRGDMAPYGMTNVARSIPNSKYLKAAQQLLDEVVNIRKAIKQPDKEMNQNTHENAAKKSESGSKNDPSNPQELSNNSATELTHAERQELQNKLTKLMSMLEEVDRRYRQYFHQMQIVVSSFDVIAGSGAAKPYTTLALQTISRHFRCIRDAIADQIRATRRNLGEQETSENGNAVGIPRLRFVDQQLRQQRALQQLGMMQQHAWRPQRGLPESSVSILRAWLFEHFLHPYPKDSDKIMLARQTGLSRSQVSNWFINARVRLWKPMVEEMYKEETCDPEMMDSNSSSDNVAKGTKGGTRSSEDRGEDIQQSASSSVTERCNAVQLMESRSNHIPEMEMAGSTTEDECNLFPDRFMAAYQVSDMGRFDSGSGVSLTLGLQHCEGGGMLMSGAPQHSFVSIRGDDIYSAATSSVGAEPSEMECTNPVNRRRQQQQRFNSSHLLHNFVS